MRPHSIVSIGALIVLLGNAIVGGLLGPVPGIAFGAVGIVAIFAVANWANSQPLRLGRFVMMMTILFTALAAIAGVAILADRLSWPIWALLGGVGLAVAAGGFFASRLGKDVTLGP